MTATAEDLAVDIARAAAVDTLGDPEFVGSLLAVEHAVDNVLSVRFGANLPGYRGWEIHVECAVVDGEVTVCESGLLPGAEALIAPAWIPWAERVQPGDLEPSMVLAYIEDDARLEPGYTATGDADRDVLAIEEFGLGRERVLAADARSSLAHRWQRGPFGPQSAAAVAAAAPCSTCAFVLPLAGSMRLAFGVCGNEWSPADGRVVSFEYGCGAHSQTDAERRASEWPAPDPIIDSFTSDPFDLSAPDEVIADEVIADEVVAEEVLADEPVSDEPVSDEPVSNAEPLDHDAEAVADTIEFPIVAQGDVEEPEAELAAE